MSQRKIFLSYSHRDREYLEAFLKHLRPFEHMGAVLAWHDREIRPSEDWERRIFREIDQAEAAVILVSPEMWESDFIFKEEIPRLIEAAEAGRLLLTSLFLRTTNLDYEFDLLDQEKGTLGVRLDKYQGLNAPSYLVAKRQGADRDELLSECAEKLWNLLSERPLERDRRRTAERRELTVEIRREGGRLTRGYFAPHADNVLNNSGEIDLEALAALERAGDERALGWRLFDVLFGSETQWSQLRPAVFGEKGTPVTRGVRLRILTEDVDLQELPWPLARFKSYALADKDWTFELVTERRVSAHAQLEAPCSVLMVGGETDNAESLGVEAHWESFKSLLHRAWDHPPSHRFFQRAGSVTKLWEQLAQKPRLLYVYGRACGAGESFELLLPGEAGRPAPVSWTALADALERHPPLVVLLHTIGSCSLAPPLPGALVQLHLRHDRASREARERAQIWWDDVLRDGWDPVRAFHELSATAHQKGAIRTRYRTWEPQRSDVTPKRDRPRAHLDRKVQRAAVTGYANDLVNSRQRRVCCIVVYGSAGNLVEHFAVQVTETLKEQADRIRLQRWDMRFPGKLDGTGAGAFEYRFRDIHHLQPEHQLADAFKAPRRGGPRAQPVHFLNWGCYGASQERTLLRSDLEAWLDFCCCRLAPSLPPKVRVLSYVALVTPADKHGQLCELFGQLAARERFNPPHFEMHLLQPLEKVTPHDLRVFLKDDRNTSCPREYRHEIAERICDDTRGEFEATVELLERAEHGMTWPDLHRDLPPVTAQPTDKEDFEL